MDMFLQVCSAEEQVIINSNTKQSKLLQSNLMKTGHEMALQQRDKLLEYDKTSEKRTKVIDDEGEYFSSSSVWLSPEERKRVKKKEEEIEARKNASRINRKIKIDFAGKPFSFAVKCNFE